MVIGVSNLLFEGVLFENIEHSYAMWHFVRYTRIAEIVNDTAGDILLDVGCGIGLLNSLITGKDIIGMDLNRKDILEAKRIQKNSKFTEKDFHPLIADLYFLPLRLKFDVVVCLEVLEHLIDDRSAVETLSSVLKENGVMLITLPNLLRLGFPNLFRLALRPKHLFSGHRREYRVSDVRDLVGTAPLEIEKITGIYFDFPLFHVFSLPFLLMINRKFSSKFRFFVYKALYRIYAAFWVTFERIFWQHAYYFLVVLRKSNPPRDKPRIL